MLSRIKIFKNYKGQGALEYLLIIAGAILIAAIVLSIVISSTSEGSDTATGNLDDLNSAINDKMQDALSNINGTNISDNINDETPECGLDSDCDSGEYCDDDGVCQEEDIIVDLCDGVTCNYGGTCTNGNCECDSIGVLSDCSSCSTGYTGTNCQSCSAGYYKDDDECIKFPYLLNNVYVLKLNDVTKTYKVYYLLYGATGLSSKVESYYSTSTNIIFTSEQISSRNKWHKAFCTTSSTINCEQDSVGLPLGQFKYGIKNNELTVNMLNTSLGTKEIITNGRYPVVNSNRIESCSGTKCTQKITLSYNFEDGQIAKDVVTIGYTKGYSSYCSVSNGYNPTITSIKYSSDGKIFLNRYIDNDDTKSITLNCDGTFRTAKFIVREGSIYSSYVVSETESSKVIWTTSAGSALFTYTVVSS